MRGHGYETRQVLLFHVYVRIFGLHPEQNPPFFFLEDNQSNPSIKLCPTNLKIRAKGKQNIVQGHGLFNIDYDNLVLAFEGLQGFLTSPSIDYVEV